MRLGSHGTVMATIELDEISNIPTVMMDIGHAYSEV